MAMQDSSGIDIQKRLIERAAIDANFRHQLLTNSRAAIERELGITLPADLVVQVIEETPTKLCLVLPMKQETQLSDAELKAVAGGTDSLTQEESLRLQLAMQMESRIFTTLSNIMKTQNSTSQTTITNIK